MRCPMCTPWHCPQEGRLAHDKSCQDLSDQVAQFPACQYLVLVLSLLCLAIRSGGSVLNHPMIMLHL